MTAIIDHAASSTSAPMGDRLASSLPTQLRSLLALTGLHVSVPLRRCAILDALPLGADPRTSAALPPLKSP